MFNSDTVSMYSVLTVVVVCSVVQSVGSTTVSLSTRTCLCSDPCVYIHLRIRCPSARTPIYISNQRCCFYQKPWPPHSLLVALLIDRTYVSVCGNLHILHHILTILNIINHQPMLESLSIVWWICLLSRLY